DSLNTFTEVVGGPINPNPDVAIGRQTYTVGGVVDHARRCGPKLRITADRHGLTVGRGCRHHLHRGRAGRADHRRAGELEQVATGRSLLLAVAVGRFDL